MAGFDFIMSQLIADEEATIEIKMVIINCRFNTLVTVYNWGTGWRND
jgi:hypothetical protein